MKNLKNSITTVLMMMVTLLIFSSCKKDKNEDTDSFDPTKYYVAGEGMLNANLSTSYALIFKPNAQVVFIGNGGAIAENLSYTYQNGILKFGDGFTFNIANNKITNSGLIGGLKTYILEKIPDDNAFASKIFRGTVAKNGVNNGVSCQIQYTTNGKFILKIDGFLQTDAAGDDYTLQNNGIATANTGNDGQLHLMTMADGKLYYSQNHANKNTSYYGVLNLQ